MRICIENKYSFQMRSNLNFWNIILKKPFLRKFIFLSCISFVSNVKSNNNNGKLKQTEWNTKKLIQKYALNHYKNVKFSLNMVSLSIEPFFDSKKKSTNLSERGKSKRNENFLSAEISHFRFSFNFKKTFWFHQI